MDGHPHLRASIIQFPNGTATDADNIAIRAYSPLDDKVLLQLCMIYAACEKAGIWPSQWDTVLICLLFMPPRVALWAKLWPACDIFCTSCFLRDK